MAFFYAVIAGFIRFTSIKSLDLTCVLIQPIIVL